MNTSIFRNVGECFPSIGQGEAQAFLFAGLPPEGLNIDSPLEAEGYVKGCKVIESKQMHAAFAESVASILLDSSNYLADPVANGARCFYPGFGFSFGREPQAVEVLVCLECWWVVFYSSAGAVWVAANSVGLAKLQAVHARLLVA